MTLKERKINLETPEENGDDYLYESTIVIKA
jgi:hypothetical protein